MKNIVYSLVLLSALGHTGGMIGEKNYDVMIGDNESKQAEATVIVNPPKVINQNPTVKEEIVEKKSTNFYVGLSVANTQVSGESTSTILTDGHPVIAVAKMGYNLTDNVAIEGRIGTGIKKDTVSFTTSQGDRVAGLYIKPHVGLSKNIDVFALLGYSNTQQSIGSEQVTTNGASLGAGLSYTLNEKWNVVADAVRYAKSGNNKVDASSLGVEYKF